MIFIWKIPKLIWCALRAKGFPFGGKEIKCGRYKTHANWQIVLPDFVATFTLFSNIFCYKYFIISYRKHSENNWNPLSLLHYTFTLIPIRDLLIGETSAVDVWCVFASITLNFITNSVWISIVWHYRSIGNLANGLSISHLNIEYTCHLTGLSD